MMMISINTCSGDLECSKGLSLQQTFILILKVLLVTPQAHSSYSSQLAKLDMTVQFLS